MPAKRQPITDDELVGLFQAVITEAVTAGYNVRYAIHNGSDLVLVFHRAGKAFAITAGDDGRRELTVTAVEAGDERA